MQVVSVRERHGFSGRTKMGASLVRRTLSHVSGIKSSHRNPLLQVRKGRTALAVGTFLGAVVCLLVYDVAQVRLQCQEGTLVDLDSSTCKAMLRCVHVIMCLKVSGRFFICGAVLRVRHVDLWGGLCRIPTSHAVRTLL